MKVITKELSVCSWESLNNHPARQIIIAHSRLSGLEVSKLS